MVVGYKTVVAYNHQEAVIEDFNSTSDELTKTGIIAEILGGSMGPVMNVINNIGLSLIHILVTYICGNVWVGGMIFLMLYAVISLFRLRLRIRESVPYKDNIMICDAVKSPFILGNIRPRIYLSSGLDENEVKYIMAHECAHLELSLIHI